MCVISKALHMTFSRTVDVISEIHLLLAITSVTRSLYTQQNFATGQKWEKIEEIFIIGL